MGYPLHQITESEYIAIGSRQKSYAANLRSHPTFRNGADPLFFLHPPGTKTHGSVLLLHGFTRVASASKQQAQYFFSRNFNAVALNLSGHHLSPEHWPSLSLRETAGYSAARTALKSDTTIGPLISYLNNIDMFGPKEKLFEAHAKLGGLVATVFTELNTSLDAEVYETTQKAFALLDPNTEKRGVEKEFQKYFVTDLHRYESDPFAKLTLLSALPGPLHVVGFSLGTAEAINLCAQSNLISKAVLLAPFLGDSRTCPKSDIAHFINMAGALDLFSTRVPQLTDEIVDLPGRVYCAAMLTGAFLNRDAVSDAVRKNTRSFCILAQDDFVVDVSESLEYCKTRLGSRTFVYPPELGIGHSLSPEVGNRFGVALIEEIANYFIFDEVDESNLLTET